MGIEARRDPVADLLTLMIARYEPATISGRLLCADSPTQGRSRAYRVPEAAERSAAQDVEYDYSHGIWRTGKDPRAFYTSKGCAWFSLQSHM